MDYPIVAFATIWEPLPLARGRLDGVHRYEALLSEALESRGLGFVNAGIPRQKPSGEIINACIEMELDDDEGAFQCVCDTLTSVGAPKGSSLNFIRHGISEKRDFGSGELLALYLDDVNLPKETYANYDRFNFIDTLNQTLKSTVPNYGGLRASWEGSAESAYYFYGESAELIFSTLRPTLACHPLCAKAGCLSVGKSGKQTA